MNSIKSKLLKLTLTLMLAVVSGCGKKVAEEPAVAEEEKVAVAAPNPMDVALEYANAVKEKRYDDVLELMAEESRAAFMKTKSETPDQFNAQMEMLAAVQGRVLKAATFGEPVVEQATATIPISNDKFTANFVLTKEDNNWKIGTLQVLTGDLFSTE